MTTKNNVFFCIRFTFAIKVKNTIYRVGDDGPTNPSKEMLFMHGPLNVFPFRTVQYSVEKSSNGSNFYKLTGEKNVFPSTKKSKKKNDVDERIQKKNLVHLNSFLNTNEQQNDENKNKNASDFSTSYEVKMFD